MQKLLVFLLFPFLANAEEPSISRVLRDEPASLLDIGMLRLDRLTEDFGRRVGVYWTTDAQMKEGCEMAMEQISIWIWKSLPGLFLHAGHDNTVEAAKPFDAIPDLIEISCYISAAHDSSIGRFWARRTLRDPELKIGPWN